MAYRRAELEQKIKEGNSVLLPDGRVITKAEDLPSEIELAGDDIVRRAVALGDLEAQKKKIQEQIDAAAVVEADKKKADSTAKTAKSDTDSQSP